MRKVKMLFRDVKIIWRYRYVIKNTTAEIDRKEVSLVGTFTDEEIEIAETKFNAKVLEIRDTISNNG